LFIYFLFIGCICSCARLAIVKATHKLLSVSRHPITLPPFGAGAAPYRPTAAMVDWISSRIASRNASSLSSSSHLQSSSPLHSLQIPNNFQRTAAPFVPSQRPVNQNAQQPSYQLNPQQTAFYELIDCVDSLAAQFDPSQRVSPSPTATAVPFDYATAGNAPTSPLSAFSYALEDPDEIDLDSVSASATDPPPDSAQESARSLATTAVVENPDEIDLDI
jgi:hypothetical protein